MNAADADKSQTTAPYSARTANQDCLCPTRVATIIHIVFYQLRVDTSKEVAERACKRIKLLSQYV